MSNKQDSSADEDQFPRRKKTTLALDATIRRLIPTYAHTSVLFGQAPNFNHSRKDSSLGFKYW